MTSVEWKLMTRVETDGSPEWKLMTSLEWKLMTSLEWKLMRSLKIFTSPQMFRKVEKFHKSRKFLESGKFHKWRNFSESGKFSQVPEFFGNFSQVQGFFRKAPRMAGPGEIRRKYRRAVLALFLVQRSDGRSASLSAAPLHTPCVLPHCSGGAAETEATRLLGL